jgi:hypothetical protein
MIGLKNKARSQHYDSERLHYPLLPIETSELIDTVEHMD